MSQSILVTGGAGFIGSHTCKLLAQSGFIPVTLDSLATGYEAAVKWGPFINANIRDREAVSKAIKEHDIKACIHFAAYSLVGESTKNPLKYYDNNVAAGLEFISALVDNGVEAVVFSSTAAAYGVPRESPISETHPLEPINPYGASKVAFEGALHWISQASNLRYTILRYFNAAGADLDGEIGESHVPETHLLPLICQAAFGHRGALTVFGQDYPTKDGTCIRDYIHVIDLAQAHIEAVKRLLGRGESRIYNVGTGEGVTVLEALGAAARVLERPIPYKFGERRLGDPVSLVADVSRIKAELGWSANYSDLDNLIRSAAHWQSNKLF